MLWLLLVEAEGAAPAPAAAVAAAAAVEVDAVRWYRRGWGGPAPTSAWTLAASSAAVKSPAGRASTTPRGGGTKEACLACGGGAAAVEVRRTSMGGGAVTTLGDGRTGRCSRSRGTGLRAAAAAEVEMLGPGALGGELKSIKSMLMRDAAALALAAAKDEATAACAWRRNRRKH